MLYGRLCCLLLILLLPIEATDAPEKSISAQKNLSQGQGVALPPLSPFEMKEAAIQKAQLSKSLVVMNGGVKLDWFWDTRQAAALSDGATLLVPEPPVLDGYNRDLNKPGQIGASIAQSYLRWSFFTPDVLNATTSGMAWVDFVGTTNASLAITARAAYYTLDWKKHTLSVGLPLNPLVPIDCYPQVLNYSALPYDFFQPLGGGFVYTAKLGCHEKQTVDFIIHSEIAGQFGAYQGPLRDGLDFFGISSTYQRNSALPGFGVQIRWAGEKHLLGIGARGSWIRPRIWSGAQGDGLALIAANEPPFAQSVKEWMGAGLAYLFFKYDTCPMVFTFKSVFGQNLEAYGLVGGGYAITDVEVTQAPGNQTEYEQYNRKFSYTPMYGLVNWCDLQIKGDGHWQPGLFVGYGVNLGARCALAPFVPTSSTDQDVVQFTRLCAPCEPNESVLYPENPLYPVVPNVATNAVVAPTRRQLVFSLDASLKSAVRVAPRLRYVNGPFMAGLQIEYNGAARAPFISGDTTGGLNAKGKPINTTVQGAVRILISSAFNF